MKTEWCKCWRTKWHFDVMADGKGYCKHCRKPIAYFFVPTEREKTQWR